jgi:hypothetical protein
MGEFSIAYSFKNVKDQFSYAFVSVYGPNIDGDRRPLWDELAGGTCSSAMGEVNISHFPSERSGDARLSPIMVEFPDHL